MRYRPVGKHADVPALLREFSATLHEEIDYRHEADNAERFQADFAEDPRIRVPRIVRALSSGQVLTLEDVTAIKITDYDAITAAGIARADVAARLLDCYLTQIFEHGFVHADPHPGNLFVRALPRQDEEPVAWQLTFVDFGMMANVPDSVRSGLRELVIAVGTRDSDRVVRAYQMLGMILPGADLDVIEEVEAAVFARYWGRPMSELRQIDPQEVREFARQYRDLLLDLPFQVPRDLIYVARAAGILSGMCTGLDPGFNIWEQVRPYAMRLVRDEASTGVERWLDEIGDALLALLALPSQASRVLAKAERGGLPVRDEQAVRALRALGRSVDRLSGAVVAAGLLIAASVLLGTEYVGASVAAFATSGVVLAALLLGGGRR
jgi:predicted unusual protein kinase regulating ubiquinone biosynthesis (AarF/ABC1/UbiB family)